MAVLPQQIWKLDVQHKFKDNQRFLDQVIYLELVNIQACFRFPKIRVNLTGAFGFLLGDLFCLALTMVFGSNTSYPGWEPLCCAIEGLLKAFVNHQDTEAICTVLGKPERERSVSAP